MYSGGDRSLMAIVADFGATTTKVGFAGQIVPTIWQPTRYGVEETAASASASSTTADEDVDMNAADGSATAAAGGAGAGAGAGAAEGGAGGSGDGGKSKQSKQQYELDPLPLRGNMSVHSPFGDNGEITNWDYIEQMFDKVIQPKLGADLAAHPVMTAAHALAPRATREKWCELLFEKYKVPGVFLAKDGVLALYANGRTTGVAVDCGGSSTRVVPVQDGYVIKQGVQVNPVGGEALEEYYLGLLARKGRTLKPAVSLQAAKAGIKLHPSFERFHTLRLAREVKDTYFRVSQTVFDPVASDKLPIQTFVLPDDSELKVDSDRFRVPELLFNPSPLTHLKYRTSRPLHDMVVGSVLACELDARNQLFSTIVLTGGGSVFKGLSQRLQHEVSIVAATKSKVVAANVKERRLGVWIGGSILGSLGSFHDMWVGASEYADHGASIIDRKCP